MSKKYIFATIVALALTTYSVAAEITSGGSRPSRPAPHIVILLADDLGRDVAPCHSEMVHMPFLESLCDKSAVFTRAYTHPVCTPSRAALFTSRHPFQHGANNVAEHATKLSLSETTFLERLESSTGQESYTVAGFGKWHLGDDANGGLLSPNLQGFDHFEGTPRQHQTYEYWNYDWWVNGERYGTIKSTYRTTFITDRVADYFESVDGPQLLFIGFTNPHLPFHAPPDELHSQGNLAPPPKPGPLKQAPAPGYYESNSRDARLDRYFFAMLEALDNEIERLVRSVTTLSDRPVVFIFAGDNGTSAEVYQGDTSVGYRAKGMLYEGGVNIPLQVWSSDDSVGIKPDRIENLFHFTDIGPTILALVGADTSAIRKAERETDGINQLSQLSGHHGTGKGLREFLYLERGTFEGAPFAFGSVDKNGGKLIIWEESAPTFPAVRGFSPAQIEFYATNDDPGEKNNLITSCDVDFDRVLDHLAYIRSLHLTSQESATNFQYGVYRNLIDKAVASCD